MRTRELKYKKELDEIINKRPYEYNNYYARELVYKTGITWKEALTEIHLWKYIESKETALKE
jgi:hypothetical protein